MNVHSPSFIFFKECLEKSELGEFFCYAYCLRLLEIHTFYFICYPFQRCFLLLKQLHFWECELQVNSFGRFHRLWSVFKLLPPPPASPQSFKKDLAFGMEFGTEKAVPTGQIFPWKGRAASRLRRPLVFSLWELTSFSRKGWHFLGVCRGPSPHTQSSTAVRVTVRGPDRSFFF